MVQNSVLNKRFIPANAGEPGEPKPMCCEIINKCREFEEMSVKVNQAFAFGLKLKGDGLPDADDLQRANQ